MPCGSCGGLHPRISSCLLSCVWLLTAGVRDMSAQTMPISWVRGSGGPHDDFGWAIAADEQGNCYATGHFDDNAPFASSRVQSRGNSDICLMKFSARGVPLWVVQAGGTDFDDGHSVALDLNGNIYITGFFGATADFGGQTLASSGNKDFFLARYDQQGRNLCSQIGRA